MRPAAPQEFAVIIDELFRFARTFGIKIPEPRRGAGDDRDDDPITEATKFYREALAKCPADLLQTAVKRVTASYRYGHRLPPPGDLEAAVKDEWTARKLTALRMDMASRRAG